MAIKIDSIQKGYYKAKIGDVILTNRTTERKAKDDGINYCLANNLDSYTILFPDFVEVSLDGLEDEPPTDEPEPPTDDEPVDEEPPIDPEPPVDEEPPTEPPIEGDAYVFDNAKWGIVEGVVSDEVALENKVKLEASFTAAKDGGFTSFNIDALDAYYHTKQTDPWNHRKSAIRLPSDFNLVMSSNTHIRQQPNDKGRTILMTTLDSDNITIDGGNFHGDRDTHDYTVDGGEWGHLIYITASNNITIKNCTIMDAGGDGIDLKGNTHSINDGYKPNSNVLITNNKILRCRRNGISVTDGRNIIIENNEIIDTGIDTEFSKGTLPKAGIDIEPFYANGHHYEIAEDIIIRNNTEINSKELAFWIFAGERITIEDNITEKGIGYRLASDCIIRNNKIDGGVTNRANGAFTLQGFSGMNKNNKVYGNTVKSYHKAVETSDGNGFELYDNTFIDCGVALKLGSGMVGGSKIYSNDIIDCGLALQGGGSFDALEIYENTVTNSNSAFSFGSVNLTEPDNAIIIRDNNFNYKESAVFSSVNGVDFNNNDLTGDGYEVKIVNLTNSIIDSNTIAGLIRIDSGCENLMISNNTIANCFLHNNTTDYVAANVVFENNVGC